MRHALAGVAGDDIYRLAAGIETDEGAVIDRVQDLSRPARDLFAQARHERADPGFNRLETDVAVVGLAGFVVGATGDQIVDRPRSGVDADIVIGIAVSQNSASGRVPRGRVKAIA